MTPAFKRLFYEPGNDMIVIPWRFNYPNINMVPVRLETGFMFICDDHYNPDHYPPGSCIQ